MGTSRNLISDLTKQQIIALAVQRTDLDYQEILNAPIHDVIDLLSTLDGVLEPVQA